MEVKEIDKEISRLVIEKHLLNESMKRTKSEEEQKEIKKRLIRINAEIRRTKLKYDQISNEELEGERKLWIIKKFILLINIKLIEGIDLISYLYIEKN